MTWDDVVKRWLPLVEEMERMGLDDYAVPEIFRAAEAHIESIMRRLYDAATAEFEETGKGYQIRVCEAVEELLEEWKKESL